MTVNYKVRAEVIDIRTVRPKPSDHLLVDTNVWYWYGYKRSMQSAHPPRDYQTKEYRVFLNKIIAAKAHLYWCGLSLSELGSLIERNEFELFNRRGKGLSPKEYRHNYPGERRRVISYLQIAWNTVKNIAQPVGITIGGATTDNALVRLAAQQLDAYDLFLLEAASRQNINQILTDDGDFVSVPDIQVFTANHNAIEAARTQGMLTTVP